MITVNLNLRQNSIIIEQLQLVIIFESKLLFYQTETRINTPTFLVEYNSHM